MKSHPIPPLDPGHGITEQQVIDPALGQACLRRESLAGTCRQHPLQFGEHHASDGLTGVGPRETAVISLLAGRLSFGRQHPNHAYLNVFSLWLRDSAWIIRERARINTVAGSGSPESHSQRTGYFPSQTAIW